MKLKKIILENFLTYEELEYSFQDKALLIQGINLTDKNQKSNGSGKSAIQTGIEFALTASNSRGVNDKELVTYGFDKSKVKLFIECQSRKEILEIDWTIKTKGSNLLSLKLNEKELSFSNVNDGKKQILDWLGISKEDLFNYFIINSTRFKSFFGSSNREKVDLINRFSDSSIIDGLEKIDNSKLEEEQSDIEISINKIKGGVDTIKEQIEDAKNIDFTNELEESRLDIMEEIEELEEKVEKKHKKVASIELEKKDIKEDIGFIKVKVGDLEISKNSSNELIKEQEGVVSRNKKLYDDKVLENNSIVAKDFSKYISKYEKLREVQEMGLKNSQEDLDKVILDIAKVNRFLNGLDVKLGGSITCPSCAHVFILDGDREVLLDKKSKGDGLLIKFGDSKKVIEIDVDRFNSNILEINGSIKSIREQEGEEVKMSRERESILRGLRDTLNGSEDTLSQLKKQPFKLDEMILDKNDEIRDLNFDYKELSKDQDFIKNTKIKSLHSKISDLKEEYKNLKVSNNVEAIKKLKDSIVDREKKLLVLDKELIDINDKIYNRNKWANNFKQFRLHLANKSLETMQYRTNEFLKELGNDILVRLDGYKVKANGTIKEEISATIIRDGERTFSSLSGGEQVRVLFSSILANRYLINATHPHGGLQFLGVDEIFDKVDSLGLKYLMRSAKRLETCIMIISHVSDEDLAGEDILTIQKVNGVSTIKQ
jgi:exonuclease SbcC